MDHVRYLSYIASKHQKVLGCIFIAIYFSVVVFAFTKTGSGWWIEDDPDLYAFASGPKNPLDFFLQKKLLHAIGTGNEIFPVHFASFWIDSRIAFRSVSVCYKHSIFVFLATSLSLFFVLLGFGIRSILATVMVCIWIILPSTTITQVWLSTRSYMYGLLFSCLAILIAQKLAKPKSSSPWVVAGLTVLFALVTWLALVSKEFFPTTTSLLLFAYLGYFRRWLPMVILVLLGAGYLWCRIWALGFELHYAGLSYLNLRDSIKYLVLSPYLLTGNWFCVIPLSFVATTIVAGIRSKTLNWQMHACLMLLVVSAFATLFPIWRPILDTMGTPGTWYRSHFTLNTIVIGWIALTVQESKRVISSSLCLITLGLASYSGSKHTMIVWDHIREANRIEGQFALNHPNETMLDTNPASWFLSGLRNLYPDRAIGRTFRHDDKDNSVLKEVSERKIPIWRRDGNGMVRGYLSANGTFEPIEATVKKVSEPAIAENAH